MKQKFNQNKVLQPIAVKEARDEASWNNAAQHSLYVEKLWQKASEHYQMNRWEEWAWTLMNVRKQINNNLTLTERQNLDRMEKKIMLAKNELEKPIIKPHVIYADKNYWPTLAKETRRKRFNAWYRAISQYQYEILDLMTSAGFLPGKTDKTNYRR